MEKSIWNQKRRTQRWDGEWMQYNREAPGDIRAHQYRVPDIPNMVLGTRRIIPSARMESMRRESRGEENAEVEARSI